MASVLSKLDSMNTSDETNPNSLNPNSLNSNEESIEPKSETATEASSDGSLPEKKSWTALTRFQRRVAGVLVEKSKTTPDVYPMTINGIKTASNQKSNRSPQLDLREDQVEETLYELRKMGAVIEVHSGGRVPKFKHQLYEWLGVEKVELAVIAELLLRGEQTLGDLRGRASRMDKIADVRELKPIVAGLLDKGLMVELTPPGRGQVVTHNLYQADELKRLQNEHGNYIPTPRSERELDTPSVAERIPTSIVQPEAIKQPDDSRVDELVKEVAQLREEVDQLREQLDSLIN